MITIRNPKDRPAPASYHHGMEVSGDVRTLYIAGQIGMEADGTIPDGIEAQTRLVYANMTAVLDEAGMTLADIVKTTVFLTNRNDRAAFAAIRDQATAGAKTAATLVFITGLALPQLLVEVEAIAVRAPS